MKSQCLRCTSKLWIKQHSCLDHRVMLRSYNSCNTSLVVVFRFKRTPFGLSNASEAFQKMMEQILFGIDGVQISIDDVIVHAVTMEELINRLRKVFERCRANNLRCNSCKKAGHLSRVCKSSKQDQKANRKQGKKSRPSFTVRSFFKFRKSSKGAL